MAKDVSVNNNVDQGNAHTCRVGYKFIHDEIDRVEIVNWTVSHTYEGVIHKGEASLAAEVGCLWP